MGKKPANGHVPISPAISFCCFVIKKTEENLIFFFGIHLVWLVIFKQEQTKTIVNSVNIL